MPIPYSTRAWLLLVPLPPAIVLSIFNLYHLLRNRAYRMALHNHVIILLLVCGLIEQLTDIPWYIYYFFTGTALSATSSFCYAWAYIDGVVYLSCFILMGWASIERHILVFHSHWLVSRTGSFCLHYLPLTLCLLSPLVFYFLMFFILPCDSPMDYTVALCSVYSCVINHPVALSWDSIVHYMLSICVTVFFSLTLLVRVVYQKYRIQQRIDWRNYSKMAAQLLPISALYIVLQFPPMVLYIAYTAGVPWSVGEEYYNNALFFTYHIIIFTPFVTIISLPDWQTKCKRCFLFWRERAQLAPVSLPMTLRQSKQTA